MSKWEKLITFEDGWWWLRLIKVENFYRKLLMFPWRRITRKWTMFDQKFIRLTRQLTSTCLPRLMKCPGLACLTSNWFRISGWLYRTFCMTHGCLSIRCHRVHQLCVMRKCLANLCNEVHRSGFSANKLVFTCLNIFVQFSR